MAKNPTKHRPDDSCLSCGAEQNPGTGRVMSCAACTPPAKSEVALEVARIPEEVALEVALPAFAGLQICGKPACLSPTGTCARMQGCPDTAPPERVPSPPSAFVVCPSCGRTVEAISIRANRCGYCYGAASASRTDSTKGICQECGITSISVISGVCWRCRIAAANG